MKLSQSYIFSDYPLQIQLSETRRPTYYKKGDKIPKKYEGWLFEKIKNKELLVDRWGMPIIKNSKTVNTPKYHRINAQDLYSLNILPHVKNNIVKKIKEYYNSFEFDYKIESTPIFIEYVFYGKQLEADLDNHALFYHKVFLDSIQKYVFIGRGEKELNPNYIIDNDTVKYINGYLVSYCELPINHIKERYIVINIYSDSDNQYKLEYLNKKSNNNLIYLI